MIMISMFIVMKTMNGFCRNDETPLQRLDVQQHTVLVSWSERSILQFLLPLVHCTGCAASRCMLTIPFVSIFVFWNPRNKILAVIAIKPKDITDKTYYACSITSSIYFSISQSLWIERIVTVFLLGTVTFIALICADHADTSYRQLTTEMLIFFLIYFLLNASSRKKIDCIVFFFLE